MNDYINGSCFFPKLEKYLAIFFGIGHILLKIIFHKILNFSFLNSAIVAAIIDKTEGLFTKKEKNLNIEAFTHPAFFKYL